MWDDQLRSISVHKLKKFNIEALIEPVIWFYRPVVSLPSELWEKYAQVFSSVWIASCFKGATGSNQIITDASKVAFETAFVTYMLMLKPF